MINRTYRFFWPAVDFVLLAVVVVVVVAVVAVGAAFSFVAFVRRVFGRVGFFCVAAAVGVAAVVPFCTVPVAVPVAAAVAAAAAVVVVVVVSRTFTGS